MSEYNIDLSDKLIRAAEAVIGDYDRDFDAGQAVSYLSLLSCEIAMKALLEQAGVSTSRIRKRSHKLTALLKDIGNCEIPKIITQEQTHWGRATCIRSKPVKKGTLGTVGKVLDAKAVSKYPNEIRYGTKYSHFDPDVLLETAKQVHAYAREYWDTIRLPQH